MSTIRPLTRGAVLAAALRVSLGATAFGRTAQQRAADSQVKAFGERMVADHGTANDELMQIGSARGLQLPAEPDRGHKREAERLAKLWPPSSIWPT